MAGGTIGEGYGGAETGHGVWGGGWRVRRPAGARRDKDARVESHTWLAAAPLGFRLDAWNPRSGTQTMEVLRSTAASVSPPR